MMKTVDVLDCASLDSAIQLLAGLFGTSESAFKEKLLRLPIDFEHATRCHPKHSYTAASASVISKSCP
jgi:hypothetical protein